ncbi:hypothetical protein M413DRAFT_448350 [Hebeloma cylindrosporum]|uniref:DUF6534 domain-containing protein n=1 Tax=Hebeloma cylindrosporum TaxID=76867 RepID=A0A0C3BLF2_HEBCY|nr:hypothetical protein M413DRAFT_448350 [Hebeloma cylindrosporum h7]
MALKLTLDNTIGAAFLGLSASCILTGIAMVQTQLYYHSYHKDWIFQKVAVGVLIILTVLHLAFTLHACYYYLITNFGNLVAIQKSIEWSFKLQVLISAFMILFVQALYALRIWKLGRHYSTVWPAVVAFIVAGGWGLGFTLVAKTYEATNFTNLDKMSGVVYATYSTATAIDFIIAFTMCYYLYRSRSSFSGTNNKIVIVMRYVLITGCLTSACSLSALITYGALPHTMVFIGIDFILGNLYVVSYIAMLNARKSMNERELSSVEVNSVGKAMRPGMGLHSETLNIHSMDDKVTPDVIPLSEAKFRPSYPTQYGRGSEQGIPSKQHLGITVHRTEARKYDWSG